MSPAKSCAVCGDKALGYNFNAVTCESCKAFFRRNALAKKKFICPFNENCEITTVTRRFCQKCRLKKCLGIGMKSENIMSEEDKLIKRRKIESNRAKKRLNESKTNSDSGDSVVTVKQEQQAADSSGCDALSGAYDSQSCCSFDSANNGNIGQPSSSTNTAVLLLGEPLQAVNPELMSGEEMVEFIVCDPDRASQAISRIMRNPKEALGSIEKILTSQKDALKLISHLISYPGDALKIISKIMNSPFDALTVFTKFMSSPTDALEIISKIVSSPQDVLQFIRNLMDSPEDALDIMNKFMNTPAEALKILNKIFNGASGQIEPNLREQINQVGVGETHDTDESDIVEDTLLPNFEEAQQQQQSNPDEFETTVETENNAIIHSMLNNSPNGSESMLPPSMTPTMNTGLIGTPTAILSPFTPSPQAISINSPLSVVTSDMTEYNSPTSLNDELPSTSAGFASPTHTNITSTETVQAATAAAEFASEHFDIKTFIHNSFPENAMNTVSATDSLNSLESVLTEVIRIEYEAFSNLPPDPRLKQETQQRNSTCMRMVIPTQQHQLNSNQQEQQQQQGAYTNNRCYMTEQQATTQPICAPSSVIMGRDLNEAEQMKLRELKMASEALTYPVDDDLSVLMMGDDRIKQTEDVRQDPKLMQLINLTAVAIKRLIKMAKKITAFRDMCQEDQVALLKGGCTEMMIMRSVMTYDDDRNIWKIPHLKEDMSTIRADVLKRAKGNVYEEHLKFIRTFDEKWRIDENIILIMCAIVLFTPTRSRVIHSDVIRLEQNSYYYLLRRYLESVYPGCEAKSAFIKLIQKISDVERLNQFIIGVYLNVNPLQVEPLLREIFDLKNH